uniref:RNA-directed DNA polymerase, eukaryota, reverse transcriptase zinc-binding domain protein n=1 Tax=Tanacetum cinerariifolium TaxID=118510 RepID=A0A6L2MCX3_TANCI|nr:RNA-directed DNA polymerase, eukaryota, reverse transcriptase zinc-binding domain protein [Tanacetum cinerariifolium]
MPLALTSKGLWNVCAPHGRLADAFITYKLSKGGSFGKFLFFNKEECMALSTGRVCISTKSQQLISEIVQVDFNNESYEASVQEIGSWSIKINDDYIDTSSNDEVQFVGVQESKMTRIELFRIKTIWGNFAFDYACRMSRGHSGGLIPVWDPNSFTKDTILCDDSFIIVKGKWNNSVGSFYMMNIYGLQDQASKLSLWNKIKDFMHHHPPILCLVDIPMGGHSFTWMNKAEDFGPSPFKLYNSWLLRDGFDEFIKLEWDVIGPNVKCHDKFQILKTKIRQWIIASKARDISRKTTALEEINFIEKKIDAGFASHSEKENQINPFHEIKKLDSLDSIDLIQKAHVKWDVECDENTKDRDNLERQVTLEEIKEAIWDCGSSKAPGPDGYTFAFVKKFWGNYS